MGCSFQSRGVIYQSSIRPDTSPETFLSLPIISHLASEYPVLKLVFVLQNARGELQRTLTGTNKAYRGLCGSALDSLSNPTVSFSTLRDEELALREFGDTSFSASLRSIYLNALNSVTERAITSWGTTPDDFIRHCETLLHAPTSLYVLL